MASASSRRGWRRAKSCFRWQTDDPGWSSSPGKGTHGYGALQTKDPENGKAAARSIVFGQMFFNAETGELFLFSPMNSGAETRIAGDGLSTLPLDGPPFTNCALPPEMSTPDWRRLSDCLWGAGGAECGYTPLYADCPTPESESPGDPARPSEMAVNLLPPAPSESGVDSIVRVSWKYLNNYGAVPQRDDVRFNIAVKETAIPVGGSAPVAIDYPSMEEATGKNFEPIDGEIGISGSATLLRNASYAGHTRWTDPVATTVPREYKIDFPGACNRRYLIRIMPKRFCFDQSKVDQSNVAYSSVDHLLYADVACN